MDTPKTAVTIEVPEAMAMASIRAAVAQALHADSARLIEAIVTTALTRKEHEYDKKSIFEQWIEKEIRRVAEEEARAIIEGQREVIRRELRARFAKAKGAKTMADEIVEELCNALRITIDVSRKGY